MSKVILKFLHFIITIDLLFFYVGEVTSVKWSDNSPPARWLGKSFQVFHRRLLSVVNWLSRDKNEKMWSMLWWWYISYNQKSIKCLKSKLVLVTFSSKSPFAGKIGFSYCGKSPIELFDCEKLQHLISYLNKCVHELCGKHLWDICFLVRDLCCTIVWVRNQFCVHEIILFNNPIPCAHVRCFSMQFSWRDCFQR